MAKTLKSTNITNATTVVASANYGFTADTHKVRAVQAVWTSSTASFTLTLQYSLDGVNWANFTTATTITSSSSNVIWDVLDTKDAPYWQVASARSSGTLTTLKIYVANELRT